jgi:hypothetical protein
MSVATSCELAHELLAAQQVCNQSALEDCPEERHETCECYDLAFIFLNTTAKLHT